MHLIAQVALTPGGVFSWILVGLISGWLAGTVMSGGGFGVVRDIILGLVGSLIGGFVSGFFITGEAGFWGSIGIAFLGSCILIAISHMFSSPRTTTRI